MLKEPNGHDHLHNISLDNIYARVYRNHPELQFATSAMLNRWYSQERNWLTGVARDYFSSGLDALANYRTVPEIQELGILVKRELKQDNLKIVLANGNFAAVLRELGIRVHRRQDLSSLKSAILTLDRPSAYGPVRSEIMVTDARLLLTANKSSLSGIRETIERAAEIRDAVNRRDLSDSPQRIGNRALAYAARFFHSYLQTPHQLEVPEDIQMLTDIYSPKFLDEINYAGITNFRPGDGANLPVNGRSFKLLSFQH